MALARRTLIASGAWLTAAAVLSGCSASTDMASGASASTADGFLDTATAHTVELTVDAQAVTKAITTYKTDSKKTWIKADLKLDGTTYEKVGIRLKGNSSLKSISTDTDPAQLPWLIRLDKYVDGASADFGRSLIVRSNSSVTALNEAVALDVIAAAGLASQKVAYAKLSINGSAPALRLLCQDLDEQWTAQHFTGNGLLYKAQAGGDYSYRGTDPASYDDIFSQETGSDNLTPLMEFLQFINESSDTEFTAGLAKHLDTAKFATYLACESLIDNFDIINGPGNNSYLWWTQSSDQMTVVPWDHNCAFGLRPNANGGGGAAPAPGGGDAPGYGGPPSDRTLPGGAPSLGQKMGKAGAGGQSKANPLVDRYNKLLDGAAAVAAEKERLKTELYTSGRAQQMLDRWVAVVKSTGLVQQSDIASDSAAITRYFS